MNGMGVDVRNKFEWDASQKVGKKAAWKGANCIGSNPPPRRTVVDSAGALLPVAAAVGSPS